MPRKATGQILTRPSGLYARFWAVVDGERIRITKPLNTTSRAAAKVKLARLIAEAAEAAAAAPSGTTRAAIADSARRIETFSEAAVRIHKLRRTQIRARNADFGLLLMRRHAFELIGTVSVSAVTSPDINAVLDAVAAAGVGRGSVDSARQHMAAMFVQLKREGVVTVNPVEGATMPVLKGEVKRERAVLTDAELAIYLEWQHPSPGRRMGVLERQTMAIISRTFGGVRTGDLHVLKWESFDVEQGKFEWGWAPRQKKRRPQLLEVPAMLRPIVRRWWTLAGEPLDGLMFPVRRENCSNNRAGLERQNVSHARALRRDLARAFKASSSKDAPRQGSPRWRELFQETEHTRPVDFHSGRRSYCQSLDDAGATPQQALALAGHTSLQVHGGYLRNGGKMRRMPVEALPKLGGVVAAGDDDDHEGDAEPDHEKALRKGTEPRTIEENDDGTEPSPLISLPFRLQGSSRVSLDIGTKPLETSGFRLVQAVEKALEKPFHRAAVVALPVSPKELDALDLARAIDGAVLAGEPHRARELLAVLMERLARRERRTRQRGRVIE